MTMNGKSRSSWRSISGAPAGDLGAIYREGLRLRERQPAWNGLLPLEAQERTWLFSWSGGVLRVFCQSPVWVPWLRRHEKKVLKAWNAAFPAEAAGRIEAVVRPLPPVQAARPLRRTWVVPPSAPPALRGAAEDLSGELAAALRRLADTLEGLQAEAAAAASTKEKGARLVE